MNTALVTGAARGIGLATVRAFVTAGWRVLALDLDFSGPEEKNVSRVKFDLQDLPAIPGLIESLGDIHALVNNAGVQNALPYDKYTDEARRRILRINLEAPAELIRAVAAQMIARHSGRIVNLASIASSQPHPDLWYGITKAGVVSLTRSFASYLGRHGIQVNAVAPGPVDTELLKIIDSARRDALLKQVYTGRMGTPEEIAAAILWLATASPSIVNGSVLDINDGTYPR
jgi:NAD(P)-dependent dehydrogenase (short-subunit alcohol dehydrogenase family)